MNCKQYESFLKFKTNYSNLCSELGVCSEQLAKLAQEAAKEDTPYYDIENPVVYNFDYDKITENSEIKLLVVGDNPGKEEQMTKNQRFLVGQSGRIAEGFFRKNPELGIDFRQNVIILNKTPIHTAKTKHIRFLEKNGGEKIENLIASSQISMANMTAELSNELNCPVWIVGYSELKEKGIFKEYKEVLWKNIKNKNKLFVFQHFSMNRFLVDLNGYRKENTNCTLEECLENIGSRHRLEIFGN